MIRIRFDGRGPSPLSVLLVRTPVRTDIHITAPSTPRQLPTPDAGGLLAHHGSRAAANNPRTATLRGMPGLDGYGIRVRLGEAQLYLCTDARTERGDLAEFADAALAGGVDIIQLRDKDSAGAPLDARHELAALEVLAEACSRHGALLAVNDRADIALAADADVLHLGQDDMPVDLARHIVGDQMAVGRSTHDVVQADSAATERGVDYFCTGPVWSTPTKPGREAAGLELVGHAAEHHGHGRPWFAIGGVDHANLDEVMAAGAERVVVVRAITEAEDPREAAAALRSRLQR